MATNLTVNGVSYAYPDTGDQSWGVPASAWAAAVTSGMLQKAGGVFTLTADANFGSNFGLIAAYFTSAVVSPASTGAIRLANLDAVSWRNNGNTADVALAKNSSDQLTYAGTAFLSAAGVILPAGFPALTGDVTSTAGSTATTVAKIQGTTVSGTTGSGNVVFSASPTFTGSITAPTFVGALTGNASTATTATNFSGSLAGEVSGAQGSTVMSNAAVIAKVLTGYTSGAGTISATDSILSAVQKLNGNIALKAPLASPSFTGASSFSGALTLAGGAIITGGSASAGGIYLSAGGGLDIQGITGSTNDLSFRTPGNADIFHVPTGTSNVVFAGNTTTGGLIAAGGATVDTAVYLSVEPSSALTTGTSQYGFVFNPLFTTGATNRMVGGYIDVTLPASGAVTNAFGLWIDSVIVGASATATNYYGVFLAGDKPAGVTNPWAFYSSGTANSALGGKLSLGLTTAPGRTLEIDSGATATPAIKFTSSHSTAANGSVASVLTASSGPTGASTAVQGWMLFDIGGTTHYVPYW